MTNQKILMKKKTKKAKMAVQKLSMLSEVAILAMNMQKVLHIKIKGLRFLRNEREIRLKLPNSVVKIIFRAKTVRKLNHRRDHQGKFKLDNLKNPMATLRC
ncbi:uncharacterized protein LOC117178916 [Belonocnema kinseyi]|uniref:uncharacterized protein LOC117178916 n=1 Tax=Belonocnema kinseyi TaxID=2817044 RepID=UPI00143D1FA3|nr:uncharacterized protein LOC117178916 [Belonocnema kinseyi]